MNEPVNFSLDILYCTEFPPEFRTVSGLLALEQGIKNARQKVMFQKWASSTSDIFI